jgi:hydrogenase nickel incorporation protein HypA/HybF
VRPIIGKSRWARVRFRAHARIHLSRNRQEPPVAALRTSAVWPAACKVTTGELQLSGGCRRCRMHETLIATSLVDSLLELARAENLQRIEAVELEVGVLRQVVPEALKLAFEAAAAGTLADGASLRIVEIPAQAECQRCGHRFPVALDDYLCPACGQADARIVAGNDIILKNVVCQTAADGAVT